MENGEILRRIENLSEEASFSSRCLFLKVNLLLDRP